MLQNESRISREKMRRVNPTWIDAPQSYCLLHADGSLQGEVHAEAPNPTVRAAAKVLGVIRQMQTHHPEPDVGAERPGDVGRRAGALPGPRCRTVARRAGLSVHAWLACGEPGATNGHGIACSEPEKTATRWRISRAALLVKVTARIS